MQNNFASRASTPLAVDIKHALQIAQLMRQAELKGPGWSPEFCVRAIRDPGFIDAEKIAPFDDLLAAQMLRVIVVDGG